MWASCPLILPLILVCTLLSYCKEDMLTYSDEHFAFLYFPYSYTVFLDSNWDKFYPLFRPMLCHVFFLYGYHMLSYVMLSFVKDFILCEPILKTCVFLVQTFILLKLRFESWTDANVRPYIIHGKVNEVSTFLLPDLLQHTKLIKSEVCSDWLNCCIGPSDWLVKIVKDGYWWRHHIRHHGVYMGIHFHPPYYSRLRLTVSHLKRK